MRKNKSKYLNKQGLVNMAYTYQVESDDAIIENKLYADQLRKSLYYAKIYNYQAHRMGSCLLDPAMVGFLNHIYENDIVDTYKFNVIQLRHDEIENLNFDDFTIHSY